MDYTKEFLGCGWAFPVQTDKSTGRIKMSSYEDDIAEAIKIVLMTRRGERVMRPDFGSRLHDYVFSSGGYTNINLMKNEIVDALTAWEPRITDIESEITPMDGGGFAIELAYTVRSTNNPFNLVFPFYINEGNL